MTDTSTLNTTAASTSATPAALTAGEIYGPHLLGVTAACVFIISIVGTVGNSLAAVSLLQSKKLRQSPSTAFMVNVVVCLLPVCAIGMPMYGIGCLQVRLYGHIRFPEWVCVGAFTIGLILTQVHLHSICALAFNRLLAVMYPVLYKRVMQTRKVMLYLIVLWIYSVLLWLPLTFGLFGQLKFTEEELLVSMVDKSRPRIRKALHIFFTYILPIFFTSTCYILMYIKVRHSRQSRMARRRRKSVTEIAEDNVLRQWDDHVTRTILVIFMVLITCSLPHIVVHVSHLHTRAPAAWLLLHVVFWLQFCVDPIIYVSMSQQYRNAILQCLSRCCSRFSIFQVSEAEQKSEPKSELKTDANMHVQVTQKKDTKPLPKVHFSTAVNVENTCPC